MAKKTECPCCGARNGEKHDPDCALVAYVGGMGKERPLLSEPGYERLAAVLERAFDQAARGKGKERHANGEPFHQQVMQDGARRFGVGALLFQAFKKSEESQRLPLERGVNELLGAIVYLAGAVIAREAEAQSTTTN